MKYALHEIPWIIGVKGFSYINANQELFNYGYSNRSVRYLMQDTVNDGLKRIPLPSAPYIPVLQCGDIRRGYPTNFVDLTRILRDTE